MQQKYPNTTYPTFTDLFYEKEARLKTKLQESKIRFKGDMEGFVSSICEDAKVEREALFRYFVKYI